MIRKEWVISIIMVWLVLFFSCGKNIKEDNLTENLKKDISLGKKDPLKTKTYENKFIKISLKEGYEVFDKNLDQGLMRIFKKGDINGTGPTIYLNFYGSIIGKAPCITNPREEVANFSHQYKGSEVETITFNNLQFYKTTYEYEGPQVIIQTKLDGSCIHIKLAGKDILKNNEIIEMLNTVYFKITLPEGNKNEKKDGAKPDEG